MSFCLQGCCCCPGGWSLSSNKCITEGRQEGHLSIQNPAPSSQEEGDPSPLPLRVKDPKLPVSGFILIQTKSFWSSKKHGHDTATEHARDTVTTLNAGSGWRPGAFWLPKEKLLSGAGPNSQGLSACSWAGTRQQQFPPGAGTGRSLDAVQDLALHAVLDLAPPHHQLQHLVDGMFWVFLQKERAKEDEPAWNS